MMIHTHFYLVALLSRHYGTKRFRVLALYFYWFYRDSSLMLNLKAFVYTLPLQRTNTKYWDHVMAYKCNGSTIPLNMMCLKCSYVIMAHHLKNYWVRNWLNLNISVQHVVHCHLMTHKLTLYPWNNDINPVAVINKLNQRFDLS